MNRFLIWSISKSGALPLSHLIDPKKKFTLSRTTEQIKKSYHWSRVPSKIFDFAYWTCSSNQTWRFALSRHLDRASFIETSIMFLYVNFSSVLFFRIVLFGFVLVVQRLVSVKIARTIGFQFIGSRTKLLKKMLHFALSCINNRKWSIFLLL